MRTVLIGSVVVGLLVFGSGTSAGLPYGICRNVSKHRCEQILGPYSAAQFLKMRVIEKLRGQHAAPSGESLYCDRRHTPLVFRCGFEQVGVPSPCKVEALVARDEQTTFRFVWLKESSSCTPQPLSVGGL